MSVGENVKRLRLAAGLPRAMELLESGKWMLENYLEGRGVVRKSIIVSPDSAPQAVRLEIPYGDEYALALATSPERKIEFCIPCGSYDGWQMDWILRPLPVTEKEGEYITVGMRSQNAAIINKSSGIPDELEKGRVYLDRYVPQSLKDALTALGVLKEETEEVADLLGDHSL